MSRYQTNPRLSLYTRSYSLDSRLGTISLKMGTLCSDSALPALLPLPERILEVLLCQAPSAIRTGSTPRKEGSVLFNDALNIFYLRLYGVRHIVKDHSECQKGNPLLPHRLFFLLTARVILYAPSHRQDSKYHSLCYTSRGALAGTRNSSMGPPHEGSIRRPIGP